jgi:predicted transcriptional regulator
VTRKRKNGISYIISPFFSGICALFTLYIGWGISYSVQDGVPLESMWHLLLMALLSLLGALYRDSWFFNSTQQVITSFYGFAFLGKRLEYRFDDIERIELTHFVRGSEDKDAKPNRKRLKAMVVLSLRLDEDTVKDLEIIQEKSSGGRTERAAQALSAATGLGLFVDRPRDLDLKVGLKDL